MSKRSLLLAVYFAITGCTIDCVEPGLQSRNTSVNVDVPVHKSNKGVKIHWVDSGQIITQGEKIKFTLSGSVNFCPLKEGKNQKKYLYLLHFVLTIQYRIIVVNQLIILASMNKKYVKT